MKIFIFLWIAFATFNLYGNSSSFYDNLNVLPFDNHGMFTNKKYLEQMLSQHRPKYVIEVGSWLGASARYIATQLPIDGKLYCIDTWLGSSELFIVEDWYLENLNRFPILYQQFLSNNIHSNLQEVIIPVRMTSLEAAEALNVYADMIFIDAAHDTLSVKKDILAWWPHLKNGGLMCGDDWSWESVRTAVIEAAHICGVKYYGIENFWWFEANTRFDK